MINKKGIVAIVAMSMLCCTPLQARKSSKTATLIEKKTFAPSRDIHLSTDEATPRGHRIEEGLRLFQSPVIEAEIARIKALLANPKLAQMFEQCFPNTIDTTVHFKVDSTGQYDSFVVTGDINAMWLRDSGAQVWPYIQYSLRDSRLKAMIAGTINRQFKCINIDAYANAFNDGPTGGYWQSDETEMKLELHERKYEIDSNCYPIRLAHEYWKVTGDTSIFGSEWIKAIENTLRVWSDQQKKEGKGHYYFRRKTTIGTDLQTNRGWGNPVKPVGLICSAFRPSDDATVFQFLVPSNFMAISSLRKAAQILIQVNHNIELAQRCTAMADEVEQALKKYAVVEHPKYGKIYAYEVDGYGGRNLMDDANVPSLLAMPYLGDVDVNDPIYQNTRRFVLSTDNPYFYKGSAGEGIGGPHIGDNMIWPMSIMMRAFTSQDDAEIKQCITTLIHTDADTGFMHESFHRNNANDYTRSWFAWQNTLFGELIIKLINDGKLDLLNSIE